MKETKSRLSRDSDVLNQAVDIKGLVKPYTHYVITNTWTKINEENR